MQAPMDPRSVAYFDGVLDKIAAHPRYGPALQKAVNERRPLVLNYHTHGPEQGWCVSVCTRDEKLAVFDLETPLEELAHIRGIAQREDECDPLMSVFSARLSKRYGLAAMPLVFLNGSPR